MTAVLYLAVLTLTAMKLNQDLGVWTERTSKMQDLFAWLVLLVVSGPVIAALALV